MKYYTKETISLGDFQKLVEIDNRVLTVNEKKLKWLGVLTGLPPALVNEMKLPKILKVDSELQRFYTEPDIVGEPPKEIKTKNGNYYLDYNRVENLTEDEINEVDELMEENYRMNIHKILAFIAVPDFVPIDKSEDLKTGNFIECFLAVVRFARNLRKRFPYFRNKYQIETPNNYEPQKIKPVEIVAINGGLIIKPIEG